MRAKKVRLLVVDEQQSYYNLLRDYVEMCRHEYDIECAYAADETEALGLCGSWHPSIVLVDAHLPDKTGFGLLEKIIDQAASVIITSTSLSFTIEESAKKRGANGYLPKTDNFDDLDYVLSYIVTVAADQVESH